jgi:MraW methylase family protein
LAAPHTPVLLEEVLEWLCTTPDGTYIDATLGSRGHSEAIAKRLTCTWQRLWQGPKAMGKAETASRNKSISGPADGGESRDGETRALFFSAYGENEREVHLKPEFSRNSRASYLLSTCT